MADDGDTAQVVVRMEGDLHAQLREASERNERTISGTVRLAIKNYLRDEQLELAAG